MFVLKKALKSFLSNLIQGPSPELVCEPYKHKSLVDFKFSVILWLCLTSRGMRVKMMMCKRRKQKMNEKDGNKTFTECKISTTFLKKYF
jgi:hypothetical protein